ncbi:MULTISPECIES: hypothetical protein [unclassified Amycolatopsis]|uniref:hypothetical protein n=1 Tax=unclassified Amycolatopsis TaxID=2618356 RepID=UPI001C69B043|nr:hypothetical protein [Amycolatopsis sp. DSM 110486]QYN19037.1 hypothetical protein K1T34_41195 [Amycolatopsis sp. DSM 110486]
MSEWARRNAAVLRQLAAHITGAEGMSAPGRRVAAGVARALAANDAAALLEPLAATRRHLVADHVELAGQVGDIGAESGRVRDEAISDRRRRTNSWPTLTVGSGERWPQPKEREAETAGLKNRDDG